MGDDHSTASKLHAPFYMNGVLVEPEALRISGGRTRCRIEPKVMGLLIALCERPGQLCRRADLLARVWGDDDATDESLTRAIYQLRKALKRVAAAAAAL